MIKWCVACEMKREVVFPTWLAVPNAVSIIYYHHECALEILRDWYNKKSTSAPERPNRAEPKPKADKTTQDVLNELGITLNTNCYKQDKE